MVLKRDPKCFRITVVHLYAVLFNLILSMGLHEFVPHHPTAIYIHRLFIYNELFTYVVSGYLLYSMRVLELCYGSYAYMSVLFTVFVTCALCKLLLSVLYLPPYGIIMYVSSLFSLYWKSIPSCSLQSYPITKAISVSEKVVNGFLLVLLSWTCGASGFFEGIVGVVVGLIVYRNYVRRRWIFPFPSILTSLLLKFVSTVFEDNMAYHSDMDEEDAIFPLPPSSRPPNTVTEENVAQLMNLGFTRLQSMMALQSSGNDVNTAANTLLSLSPCYNKHGNRSSSRQQASQESLPPQPSYPSSSA